jgi:hypothetical protein
LDLLDAYFRAIYNSVENTGRKKSTNLSFF